MALRSATALALLSLLLALPAQGGTPDSPEVADTSGDAGAPPLDIASAWFEANATHLAVHIQRAEGSDTAPTPVACQDGTCAGTGISLRVVFAVLKADGSPAPTLEDYASSYVLVRLGPDDPSIRAVTGFYDSEGTATVVEPVGVAIDGPSLVVSVPVASETIGMAAGLLPGSRVSAPYALSYVMACAPDAGCLSQASPHDATAALWDRAPDSGTGADYWLPAPAAEQTTSETATSTAPSATTVTVVQTQTATVTRTETFAQTETVTVAPSGVTESKTSPTAGILMVFAIVGLAAVRRRLA